MKYQYLATVFTLFLTISLGCEQGDDSNSSQIGTNGAIEPNGTSGSGGQTGANGDIEPIGASGSGGQIGASDASAQSGTGGFQDSGNTTSGAGNTDYDSESSPGNSDTMETSSPSGSEDSSEIETDRGPCPGEMECTAPLGEFVCTLPNELAPTTCSSQDDCEVGVCTPVPELSSYCIRYCAPEAIDKCPSGTICNEILGAAVCMEAELTPPVCETQADCSYGECILSLGGTKYCIQPCYVEATEECPEGSFCTGLFGKFYCASPSSGIPDTCDVDANDCRYGSCLSIEGEDDYCVQECIPKYVQNCPDDTSCLAFLQGFACGDRNTYEPPSCESQSDCSFGTCLRAIDGNSYCVEYCAEAEEIYTISGMIFDMTSALSGVDVCLYEDSNYCDITDSDGAFLLSDLPPQETYILSVKKQGYQASLAMVFAFQTVYGLLFKESEIGEQARLASVDYPQTNTGAIIFLANEYDPAGNYSPVAGFQTSLSPMSGAGPYYSLETNSLSPSLSSSTSVGWGAYFGVSPGNYSLGFSHDTLTCESWSDVTVADGYMTIVPTYCQ